MSYMEAFLLDSDQDPEEAKGIAMILLRHEAGLEGNMVISACCLEKQ